jgi:hypothetical protein
MSGSLPHLHRQRYGLWQVCVLALVVQRERLDSGIAESTVSDRAMQELSTVE